MSIPLAGVQLNDMQQERNNPAKSDWKCLIQLLVTTANLANFFGGSEKSSIFAVPNEKEV